MQDASVAISALRSSCSNCMSLGHATMQLTQEMLRNLWHTSAPERLTPWMQCRALALRDVCRELDDEDFGLTWIAQKLLKTDESGKQYTTESPSKGSVCDFFKKVDADPDWFPGKHNGEKRGPKPLLTKAKRARIAASGHRQKREGDEPCPAETVAKCPVATRNPLTKRPFCDKTIRKVWTQDCYDFVPEHPWRYQHPT